MPDVAGQWVGFVVDLFVEHISRNTYIIDSGVGSVTIKCGPTVKVSVYGNKFAITQEFTKHNSVSIFLAAIAHAYVRFGVNAIRSNTKVGIRITSKNDHTSIAQFGYDSSGPFQHFVIYFDETGMCSRGKIQAHTENIHFGTFIPNSSSPTLQVGGWVINMVDFGMW